MQARKKISYVVGLERIPSDEELRELGAYLSELAVNGCDVVVLDAAAGEQFRAHGRVLRWVARHVRPRVDERTPAGRIDLVRAAIRLADCEKVILAADDVRWSSEAIEQACGLLDLHDSLEPADVADPMRWWSAIDAARLLMDRAINAEGASATTSAMRIRSARMLHPPGDNTARFAGSMAPSRLVVRRTAPTLQSWLRGRADQARLDFEAPVRSGFFLSILPLLLFFLLAGGLAFALVVAAIGSTVSILLALQGRVSLPRAYPLAACLLAPLAVLEKSISVYWALGRKLGEERTVTGPVSVEDRGKRAAG